MKNFKVLSLTLAVAASFASLPSFAADADVEALEKRIQELETRMETGMYSISNQRFLLQKQKCL